MGKVRSSNKPPKQKPEFIVESVGKPSAHIVTKNLGKLIASMLKENANSEASK